MKAHVISSQGADSVLDWSHGFTYTWFGLWIPEMGITVSLKSPDQVFVYEEVKDLTELVVQDVEIDERLAGWLQVYIDTRRAIRSEVNVFIGPHQAEHAREMSKFRYEQMLELNPHLRTDYPTWEDWDEHERSWSEDR